MTAPDPSAPDPADHGPPALSRRWPWVVILASVVVLAVTVPVYRARSSVRTQVQVVTVTPSAVPPRECDVGFAGCSVVSARPTTRSAVLRWFPKAVVLDSYGLNENGHVDTEFVQVRTTGAVVVTVQSHCGGGAGTVPDRSYGQTGAAGPVQEVFVAGGVDGCSVAVSLDVPAGAAVPGQAARALAHDAALKLPALPALPTGASR